MERLTPQFGNFVAYIYTPQKTSRATNILDGTECTGGLLLAYKDANAVIAIEAEIDEPGAKESRVLFGGKIIPITTKLVYVPTDCVFHAPAFPRKKEPLWGVYHPLLKTHDIPMPTLLMDSFHP